MAQFTGTWQIDNSTGFDDYMKAIGKTSFSRLLLSQIIINFFIHFYFQNKTILITEIC